MSKTPGTVSKILWHFTGGPGWDVDKDRQLGEPKEDESAYDALISILNSYELRASTYSESIKAFIFEQLGDFVADDGVPLIVPKLARVQTESVVCVADIPIQHLGYHAMRYGKFAVGFKRDKLLYYGFNPVLYTQSSSLVANNLIQLIGDFEHISSDLTDLKKAFIDVLKAKPRGELDIPHQNRHGIATKRGDFIGICASLATELTNIKQRLIDLGCMVKTFHAPEMDQILPEREWRLPRSFNFSQEDIAMVVLPRSGGWFDKFIESQPEFPRGIPIVPWEDLIEH